MRMITTKWHGTSLLRKLGGGQNQTYPPDEYHAPEPNPTNANAEHPKLLLNDVSLAIGNVSHMIAFNIDR